MIFFDGSEDEQKYNSSKVNSGRMNRTSGWSSSRTEGRRVSEGRKKGSAICAASLRTFQLSIHNFSFSLFFLAETFISELFSLPPFFVYL